VDPIVCTAPKELSTEFVIILSKLIFVNRHFCKKSSLTVTVSVKTVCYDHSIQTDCGDLYWLFLWKFTQKPGLPKKGHQRQLLFPVGDNYFSPLPLVNEGREGE